MHPRLQWFLKWSFAGCLLAVAITALMLFQATKQYNESHPSAYGVEKEFATLNYLSAVRHILLKVGFQDKGIVAPWIESSQRAVYEAGIAKIPPSDAERLYWDYVFYILPYKGAFLERNQISDNAERLKQAIHIVTAYPKLHAKNPVLVYPAAFEQIAISFFFVDYDYPLKGFIPWEEKSGIVISGWEGFNQYKAFYPLNNREHIGIYSMFALRLLDASAGIIAYGWDKAHLSCTHALVNTYRELREQMPDLLFYFSDGVAPSDQRAMKEKMKLNLNNVGEYQVLAEEKLKHECGASTLNRMGKNS